MLFVKKFQSSLDDNRFIIYQGFSFVYFFFSFFVFFLSFVYIALKMEPIRIALCYVCIVCNIEYANPQNLLCHLERLHSLRFERRVTGRKRSRNETFVYIKHPTAQDNVDETHIDCPSCFNFHQSVENKDGINQLIIHMTRHLMTNVEEEEEEEEDSEEAENSNNSVYTIDDNNNNNNNNEVEGDDEDDYHYQKEDFEEGQDQDKTDEQEKDKDKANEQEPKREHVAIYFFHRLITLYCLISILVLIYILPCFIHGFF